MNTTPRRPGPASAQRIARTSFLRLARGMARLEGLLLLVPALIALHLVLPTSATALGLLWAGMLTAGLFAWSTGAFQAAWKARTSSSRQPRRCPVHLRVVTPQGVLVAAHGLLQQSLADGRPLSLAVLELADLPELHQLFGGHLATRVLTRVSNKLRAVAGASGLALRTSATQFTLVLPGLDEATVRLALRTAFGDACCIEDEAGPDEVVLLPDFEVAMVDPARASLAHTYAKLRESLGARHRTREQPAPALCHREQPAPALCHRAQPAYVPTVRLPLQ